MFLRAAALAIFYACCACGVKLQNFRSQPLQTTQVFHFYIDRGMFDTSIDGYGNTEFRAALMGKPDLPKWMFLRQNADDGRALLYGSYQEPGELNIEVFAINKYNYKTSLRVVSLQVEKRQMEALYEVEMKFLNLNIEDLFEGEWLSDLEEIFRSHLWKNSPVVYVTKVASVVDVGGRVPVNPRDKEGVVVRVGGTANFSQELRTLELEANQLRNRVPCPRDYKRTSAEYRFRRKNLHSDWCGFRLITLPERLDGEGMRQHLEGAEGSPVGLDDDGGDWVPGGLEAPRRDLLPDFLVSLVAPSAVTLALLGSVACLVCCCRRQHGVQSAPSEQQSSVERASGILRQLASQRNLPVGSSAPIFRAGSPVDETLSQPSSQGTLRPRALPPPPYPTSQDDI